MRYPALLLAVIILSGCATRGNPAGEASKPLSSLDSKIKAITDLYKQGKLDEARTQCEELLKSEPKSAPAHYEMGNIHQYQDNNNAALAEFRSAFALDPSFYNAQRDIWLIEIENAKSDKAKAEALKPVIKEALEKILAAAKPSDQLYSMGFFIYAALEAKDKAKEMKDFLVAKYPQSNELEGIGNEVFEWILAETQGANRPKRAPMCDDYARDFPNHQKTDYCYRFLLGFYWKDEPKPEKVKECAERWTAVRPESPLALATSARVCAELGIELNQAIKWATSAIKYMDKNFPSLAEWQARSAKKPFWYYEWQYIDEPRPFDILDSVGWVYFKKGDLVRAESYINQAIQYENFHSRIWYHLGKVYEAQNKTDAAMDAYAHSLIVRQDITEAPGAIKALLKKQHPSINDDEIEKSYQQLPQVMAAKENIPLFTEVTTETGLADARGPRIAWGDYNNDGYQDILLGGSFLWRNKGDGTFENVTEQAQITPTNFAQGGIWADYDNDGWLDFFAAGWQDGLWHNNGDGTFINVTAQVNPKLSDGHPTEGAGWGDYDRDGFVDLYVANYENPFSVGTPDCLYKNERGLTFKDVTKEVGVTPPKNMCGRGVSWGDYNDDGWLDIFVSNYRLNPDFLWKNNGNGTFTNAAKDVGVEGKPVQGAYGHTIGSEWADYDNDGDLDLFQGNLAHPRYITFSNMSYLLTNSGAPEYRFTEHRRESGIRFEETHSDPAWGDYDNDGLLDLYITSVYVGVPSFFYRQSASGKFQDVTWITGTRVFDGWGCAWADYDNDGDLDLIVCESTTRRIHLFRNETMSKSINEASAKDNWLEVKLVGSDCNRAAIGARLTLKVTTIHRVPILSEIPILSGQLVSAPPSAEQFTREVQGGKGTTNQHSLIQHFGLGEYSGPLELTVRWPCGRTTTHPVTANKMVVINEPVRGDK